MCVFLYYGLRVCGQKCIVITLQKIFYVEVGMFSG